MDNGFVNESNVDLTMPAFLLHYVIVNHFYTVVFDKFCFLCLFLWPICTVFVHLF